MIDLDQVRKRHTRATSCCVCEETLSTYSLVCSVCGETSNNPRDPTVLALCDEVEALLAKVPEVLREWPTPEALPDLGGGWVWVTSEGGIDGVWVTYGDDLAFGVIGDDGAIGREFFEPGEFFVRLP